MDTNISIKQRIQQIVDEMVNKDPIFAEKADDPNKSIDECDKYLRAVFSSRATDVDGECCCACVTDDDLYENIMHYYDEKDIKIPPIKLPERPKPQVQEKNNIDVKEMIEKAKNYQPTQPQPQTIKKPKRPEDNQLTLTFD